ncbi:DUF4435 domain-containing protein [Allorhodopirellula solitaria]|uniref:DUF4435 domain-containing protein n=1 Tax=Allorhodopirellula solitaria TaxID=2527987 RepID=A0A5C5YJ35_9BACT|nr:DUF4435 domain-containing protein [Allorhodopirellula solitaria]TWT74882.1 hypothetical protein CA85_01680 [Allorhodopirellula solitaria]
MTRADALRASRDSYAVAWRCFLIEQGSDSSKVFCFFEGEDSKYYEIRLKTLLGDDRRIRSLSCGGKREVKRVNSLWCQKGFERTHAERSMFFIDRDFDARGQNRLAGWHYVTPCYSIENLYMRKEVLSAILENEFNTSLDGPAGETVALQHFQVLLESFLDAATLLNAWIFLQRKHEQISGQSSTLNLKNVAFAKLFLVRHDTVVRLYDETTLPELFPDAHILPRDEIRRYEEWFRYSNRIDAFRGKYLAEFLRKALEVLKTDRVSTSPQYFAGKRRVKLGLSRENIVSELSQYASTPRCLRMFVANLT